MNNLAIMAALNTINDDYSDSWLTFLGRPVSCIHAKEKIFSVRCFNDVLHVVLRFPV